jgi:hypothetical protein
MNMRPLAFYASFALVFAGSTLGQQLLNPEAIQIETRQCKAIKSTLDMRARLPREAPADDFTAAGLLCEKLDKALQASDEPAM